MSSPNILIAIISNALSILNIGQDSKNLKDYDIKGKVLKDKADIMSGRAGNLRQLTKDNLLYYPVLFTDDISIDSMKLINKAFELEYANLFKILINSIQVDKLTKEDLEKNKNRIGEYLKKFHTNISLYESINEKGVINDLTDINKREIIPLDERFEYTSLNEYSLPKYLLEEKKGKKDKADDEKSKDNIKKEINNKVEIEKELNGLSPVIISGKMRWLVDEGDGKETTFENNIVFAVKAVTHMLDFETSKNIITSNVRETNKALQLIKWRTGEIRLFRDIILAVDLNKTLAKKNTRDKNSNYWWAKLSLMAQQNSVDSISRGLFGRKNPTEMIATSTIVLSKQTVDDVKYNTGIDILRKPASAKKILNNFFLLTLAVVDESTETLYIFNEEQNVFEAYGFNEIKRKTSGSNSIKDLKELVEVFKR